MKDENIQEDIDFESEPELGDLDAAKAKLQKLKQELQACKDERQQFLDGWQRCKADTINARKESDASARRFASRQRDELVEEILPALDSFDMAMEGESWQTLDANWRKGMENVRSQLLLALEKQRITPFAAIGEQFDPVLHEPVAEEDGAEAHTIAKVFRRGYRSGEKILRAAQVSLYTGT